MWWVELPDPDLAYLVEGTPEFHLVPVVHIEGPRRAEDVHRR
jgi:hypothetical protein